jgi:hypothetical protein
VSDPSPTPHGLPVLGWKEHVELPEWGLRLRGKLDTGARSSALHVTSLEEVGVHDAAGHVLPVVRFDVVLGRRDAPRHHEIEAPVVGHKVVRDTGARAERRPVVRTRIVCGPVDTTADITLTDRRDDLPDAARPADARGTVPGRPRPRLPHHRRGAAAPAWAASMNGPITVAGVTVEPGERRDLFPTASESYTGERTTLPMAVLNGARTAPGCS